MPFSSGTGVSLAELSCIVEGCCLFTELILDSVRIGHEEFGALAVDGAELRMSS